MTRSISAALIAAVAALGACGQQGDANAQPSPSTADNRPYMVDLARGVDAASLPTNNDLKMVDGDLARYAATACHFDTDPKYQPRRCDVFAQSDRDGSLIGYLIVRKGGDGVWVESALTLNEKLQSRRVGCGVGGRLSNTFTGSFLTDAEASGNFTARIDYAAWEKEPGNWLVASEDGTDQPDNPNAARGVWYLERKGENLRLQQERWSYCYKDSKVRVDDVFRRVVTLTSKAS